MLLRKVVHLNHGHYYILTPAPQTGNFFVTVNLLGISMKGQAFEIPDLTSQP